MANSKTTTASIGLIALGIHHLSNVSVEPTVTPTFSESTTANNVPAFLAAKGQPESAYAQLLAHPFLAQVAAKAKHKSQSAMLPDYWQWATEREEQGLSTSIDAYRLELNGMASIKMATHFGNVPQNSFTFESLAELVKQLSDAFDTATDDDALTGLSFIRDGVKRVMFTLAPWTRNTPTAVSFA